MTDRFGAQRVFRIATLLPFLPVLFITHLPDLPFYGMVRFFPCFMVLMSGRMVPMQALGTGSGAWIGGLMLGNAPGGQIVGYGTVGWVAVAVAMVGVFWVSRVRGARHEPPAAQMLRSDVVGES